MKKKYYVIFTFQFLLLYACKDRFNSTKFINFNDNGIYGAFFNDKYHKIFVGNGKGQLFVLDYNLRILEKKQFSHGPVATSICSQDNEYVINTSGDGTIYIWKVFEDSISLYYKDKIHHSASMTCMFSPKMNYAVSTGHDSTILVLDWRRKKVLNVLKSKFGTIRFAWFSNDDNFLFWADDKGYLYKTIIAEHWNTTNIKISNNAVNCVVTNLDNTELLLAVESGKVLVVDFKTLKIIQVLNAHKGATFVAEYYDIERKKIATSGYDGNLTFWSRDKHGIYSLENKIKAHNGPCCTLYYNDNCTQLITGGQDGYVKIWDIKSFKLLKSKCIYE